MYLNSYEVNSLLTGDEYIRLFTTLNSHVIVLRNFEKKYLFHLIADTCVEIRERLFFKYCDNIKAL